VPSSSQTTSAGRMMSLTKSYTGEALGIRRRPIPGSVTLASTIGAT
jgi:hypothetical protein